MMNTVYTRTVLSLAALALSTCSGESANHVEPSATPAGDVSTPLAGDASDVPDIILQDSSLNAEDSSLHTEDSSLHAEDSSLHAEDSSPSADIPIIENPWGFAMRLPQTRLVDCSNKWSDDMPAQQVSDADQICTFSYDGVNGTVYLEATAVDCEYYYLLVGYFSTRAWLSVNGEIILLEDAEYSFVADHLTDYLSFTYAGRHYRYWHSSFNEFYRGCQPMHCMRVFNGTSTTLDSTAIIEDGCTEERTLPAVCVAVQPDGSVPPLEDNFTPCPDGWTARPME